MSDSPSVQNIYTFENVSVTVAGNECPVSSGVLRFTENAIPKLTLKIDPVHNMTDSMEEATAPTLAIIAEQHAYFSDLAVKRTPGTFKATVMRLDKPEQQLELKDWILTGAGITSASANSGIGLELEFQHPICLCQDAVIVMPYVPYASSSSYEVVSGAENLVDAVAAITRRYSTMEIIPELEETPPSECGSGGGAGSATGSLTAVDAVKFLQKQLSNATDNLVANMVWDGSTAGGGSWPLQSCLSGQLAQIKLALFEYFKAGNYNNLWDLFISGITTDWGCSIMPTFNGPLKLRPFSPWREVEMTIYDEDITDLSFPGIDPSPILGTTVSDVSLSNSRSYWPYSGQQQEYSSAGITYAPTVIVNSPNNYRGTIVQMNTPGWMLAAQNNQAASEGVDTNASTLESDGKLVTPANIESGYNPTYTAQSSTGTPVENWSGALLTYAQACFYTMFRQTVQVGLKLRLMILTKRGVSDGEYQAYLPGNVCRVQSSDGSVVFDFYVTSVIHSFDCAEGLAETEIAGTYARPEEGFKGIAEPGTTNPLYSGS